MNHDWPTIDHSVDGDHANDLFLGEVFSDELLDMYNSSVTPMTSILPNDVSDDALIHRGQHSVSMDYDGLGAFPPSNSMNDFTSLLENHNVMLPSHAKVSTPMKDASHVGANLPTSLLPHASSNAQVQVTKEDHVGTHTYSSTTSKPSNTVNEKKRVLEDISSASQSQTRSSPPNKKKTSQLPTNITVPHSHTNPQPVVTASRIVSVSSSESADATKIKVHQGAAGPTKQVVSTSNQAVHSNVPKLVKTSQAAVVVPQQTRHSVDASKGVTNTVLSTVVNVTPMAYAQESSSDMSCNGSVKTEESFKGVAQAAVTNLILSAGSNSSGRDDNESGFSKPVDTSTAHVAALTSSNWVAACAASVSGAPPGTAEAAQAAALAAANDPAAAKAARARRATLTADERARQNRDRNREHARNTRLRKKAYVEELKRTLTELVNQRDAAEVEKRHEKQRDLEVREVRYRVMEEFLKLRARGAEPNLLVRWIAILEDGFTFTLPKTEYRAMVASSQHPNLCRRVSNENPGALQNEIDSSKQVLRDANQCFDDASKFASFISSVFMGNAVHMSYHCERTHFMMDGVKAILDWTLNASPQMPNGEPASTNFVLKGCMRAIFSPASNKLASAEFLFDTGAVLSQVKMIKASSPFCSAEETDALLDSLPQVSTIAGSNNSLTMPSTVSVVSTDKDHSSDEECVVITKTKMEPQVA